MASVRQLVELLRGYFSKIPCSEFLTFQRLTDHSGYTKKASIRKLLAHSECLINYWRGFVQNYESEIGKTRNFLSLSIDSILKKSLSEAFLNSRYPAVVAAKFLQLCTKVGLLKKK